VKEHFDAIAARIIQFDRMRLTVKAMPREGTKTSSEKKWQSKYFDPEYGVSEEARIEAATLVGKKVHNSSLDTVLFPMKIKCRSSISYVAITSHRLCVWMILFLTSALL
jgi:hypothetical protein